MRVAYRNAVGLLLLVALVGCASLGVQKVTSFEEGVLSAQSGVSAAQDALLAKIAAGSITKKDAQNVDAQLDSAIEAIQIAIDLRAAGDPAAVGKLEAARAVVVALRKQLGV